MGMLIPDFGQSFMESVLASVKFQEQKAVVR